MISGHLQERNGYFHMVLNLKDANGKRQKKWIATGLTVKGNKKKAEQLLTETRKQYADYQPAEVQKKDAMLFTAFLRQWLVGIRSNVEASTYASYNVVVGRVCSYFDEKNILLKDLTSMDIQEFYNYAMNVTQVSANTVIHYHANIRKALQYAVKMNLIPSNPAINVERPRKMKYNGSFYNVNQINHLLAVVKGTRIEFPIMFAAFYGLRRSEIIGLKWDAIDFENRVITIKHTVLDTMVDGKYTLVAKDRTKNKSSMRSLPLVADFEHLLRTIKSKQEENKRLCGKGYNYDYDGYVFVDDVGNLFKPGYLSQHFKMLLDKNELPKIRFHDLRHSCASLLLANRVSLKEIQEWLGHSTFSTTADLYAHLDESAKTGTASAMMNAGLNIEVSIQTQ